MLLRRLSVLLLIVATGCVVVSPPPPSPGPPPTPAPQPPPPPPPVPTPQPTPVPPPPPPSALHESPFGMGVYFGTRYSESDMIRAAQLARDAGIQWSREEFVWQIVEPGRGEWHWQQFDRSTRIARDHGIRQFGLLDYTAAWASSAPVGTPNREMYMPGDLRHFENYCYEVVRRYGNHIRHWEIWNEPNIRRFWEPTPDPAAYTRLLAAGYRGVKRADPTAVVIGMDTSRIDLRFIEDALEQGAWKYMDAVSVHPYRANLNESGLREEVDALRALLRRYGGEKPIWFTEIGWPTSTENGVSEPEQAELLVRMYVTSMTLGIERVLWYNFRDDGDDPRDREQRFGIVRRDYTPKPAYTAYRTMTQQLQGLVYKTSLKAADVEAHMFSEPGPSNRSVWVAWSTAGAREVQLPIKGQRATLVTLTGEATEIRTNEGGVSVQLTGTPIYITR